jgi:hypothetical protein
MYYICLIKEVTKLQHFFLNFLKQYLVLLSDKRGNELKVHGTPMCGFGN